MGPTKSSFWAAGAALVLALAAPGALAEEVAPTDIAAPDAVAAPSEAGDEVLPAAAEEASTAEPTSVAQPVDDAAQAALEAPAEVIGETGLASDTLDPASLADPLAELPSDADAGLPQSDPGAFDTHPPLGAIGYDSEGRQGRIHIVERGDTLWDISNAYLGTPWVWPSIWNDNGEIENPHRIYPGDRIWITPSEMRVISAEEAALLLSNLPQQEQAEPAAQEELPLDEPEPPAPAPAIAEPVEYGAIRISNRELAGLITPQQMEASASIVGRERERMMLSQEDEVYVGLGEGDVQVGDQLTVFRTHEKVFDPDTNVLLGYHVEFLGWVEVTRTSPESSLASIRMSDIGLEEGDRVMPREPMPADVALRASPEVEGKISFFPQKRVVIGFSDFVYLNRGSIDGLEVGSPLDVYRPGYAAKEEVRNERVMVPDSVIGRLVVVRTEDESAVAWVMRSNTELALGDRFRGADD